MESLYKNKSFIAFSSKFEAKREMGNFFCINVNGFWLRVEVINWRIVSLTLWFYFFSKSQSSPYFIILQTDHKAKVEVQFIDYGINYETDYYLLRPLPHELYNFPRIAQRCHLADVN